MEKQSKRITMTAFDILMEYHDADRDLCSLVDRGIGYPDPRRVAAYERYALACDRYSLMTDRLKTVTIEVKGE